METPKGSAEGKEAKDDISLLVVVVDTSPAFWSSAAAAGPGKRLSFEEFVYHLMRFLHAFTAMHQRNRLAVIASHPGESVFLFPDEEMCKGDALTEPVEFVTIKTTIISRLKSLANTSAPTVEAGVGTTFSGALSLSLCYINRLTRLMPYLQSRILVFQASPDVPSQYIPAMNCIFSAQKLDIIVDACLLGPQDSTFLQQACHITNGVYLKPLRQEGLLQYLLTAYLPSQMTRQQLSLPSQPNVDYRAACFCHKKVIDMGFVCSVCLSIFCNFAPYCEICGTKFPLPKLLPKLLPKKGAGKAGGKPAPTT